MMPSKVYQIALLGFSDFERQTLASCFRLGATDGPAYALTQNTEAADFLLADADHSQSVQLVRATERAAITVFIGANPPDEAMSWMARPIDPLRVMRELGAMVGLAAPEAPRAEPAGPLPVDPRAPSALASVPGVLDTWQPETQPGWEPEWPPGWEPEATAAAAEPAPEARLEPVSLSLSPSPSPSSAPSPASASRLPAPSPSAPDLPELDLELELDLKPPHPAARTSTPDSVPAPAQRPAPVLTRRSRMRSAPAQRIPAPQTALVVDDSDIAARFLLRRLAPWGLQVDCASTSRQALAMIDSRTYDLVFVDVELGAASELDGLALCQRIKQSAATVGANVIVVSAHQSEIDRARGALAGCDAYLGKPLAEDELASLLLRRGLVKALPAADVG